nr:MAG TPA: portal protein [Caudoviricetes sp.]
MGFFNSLKNLFMPESVDTASDKLLQWLGIDTDKPKALAETTYFTCLKVLSETMGKMPLKLYQEDESGGRVRAPTADILLYRPNSVMTPSTFWSTMEANCQHYGNAYAWIQRDYKGGLKKGEIKKTAYWIMKSDCVTVYMDDAGVFGDRGRLYYKFTNPQNSETAVFRQEDVLHIKNWLSWDGVMGVSVKDILKSTIDGAGYSQKYLEKLYESGLTASSVLQYTGDLDEKLRSQLQQKYNDLLTGAKNAGKVVALPLGMKLEPLTYTLADAQYMELKKYSALQIAASFGVKPNQINDYEKSSYSNSESQQLSFLVDTMMYRLNQYEQEINYKCLTNKQRIDGFVYKFNEKVLLRANMETQMQSITAAVQNGIYTPNEGRHLLDLPSKDGGDVLIVNGNYVPLTNVGAAYNIGKEGKEDDT